MMNEVEGCKGFKEQMLYCFFFPAHTKDKDYPLLFGVATEGACFVVVSLPCKSVMLSCFLSFCL